MADAEEYRFRIDAFSPETLPMARLAEYLRQLAVILGEPNDVPFHLALLLYETRAHAAAQVLLEASLRLYGEDARTYWNLGLCYVALGKPKDAHASFRRARRLAPDLNPVGLVTVKGGGVGSGR